VGAELFHADGYTDRHDEAIFEFRNFSQALNVIIIIVINYEVAYFRIDVRGRCR
jgi:hypothetical protein